MHACINAYIRRIMHTHAQTHTRNHAHTQTHRIHTHKTLAYTQYTRTRTFIRYINALHYITLRQFTCHYITYLHDQLHYIHTCTHACIHCKLTLHTSHHITSHRIASRHTTSQCTTSHYIAHMTYIRACTRTYIHIA